MCWLGHEEIFGICEHVNCKCENVFQHFEFESHHSANVYLCNSRNRIQASPPYSHLVIMFN